MAGGLSKYIDDNLADSQCGYLVLIFVFGVIYYPFCARGFMKITQLV